MKLLVLGGTVFVGRHIVEAAVARGHEVTIFHRGRHGKGLFAGVEEVFGDRDHDLHLLKRHLPYHESDHVLNIAFNLLAGGRRLEHL